MSVPFAPQSGLVIVPAAVDGPSGRSAVQALAATTAEASRQDDAVRALSRIPPGALPWLAEELTAQEPDVGLEVLGRGDEPGGIRRVVRPPHAVVGEDDRFPHRAIPGPLMIGR